MGMPAVRTCDLDGDSVKEIMIQAYYGFSTDPNAYGEAALFEKKDGSYQPLMLPEELGSDLYRPGITVVCRNPGKEFPEWASMPQDIDQEVSAPHIHLSVKELTGEMAVDEVVLLNSDLMMDFGDIETAQEHRLSLIHISEPTRR